MSENYTAATMKQQPSEMIRGVMACFGLYFIPPNTSVNGPRYVEVLQEKLKLYMDIRQCTMFPQGGTPCHLFQVATDSLKKN